MVGDVADMSAPISLISVMVSDAKGLSPIGLLTSAVVGDVAEMSAPVSLTFMAVGDVEGVSPSGLLVTSVVVGDVEEGSLLLLISTKVGDVAKVSPAQGVVVTGKDVSTFIVASSLVNGGEVDGVSSPQLFTETMSGEVKEASPCMVLGATGYFGEVTHPLLSISVLVGDIGKVKLKSSSLYGDVGLLLVGDLGAVETFVLAV